MGKNQVAFDRVFGQVRVKEILETSEKRNKLSHAYLFYGQCGIGKDAMAIALAAGLNCAKGILGGCLECNPCSMVMNLESPDFHVILPKPTRPKTMKEEKYNDILRQRALAWIKNPYQEIRYSPDIQTLPLIGIDQIRDMKRKIVLKLAGTGHRVFIISNADKLTIPASNSLLKLLEEPPGRTVLILTTSKPGALLKTIVSRCQGLRFDPLSVDVIRTALIENFGIQSHMASIFAGMSGGSLRRALNLTMEAFEEKREIAIGLLQLAMVDDEIKRIEGLDAFINRKDPSEILEILHVLQLWMRDLLILRVGKNQNVMNFDQVELLGQYIEKMTRFNIEKGLECLSRTIDFIEKNVYLPLTIYSLIQEFRVCNQS